MVVSSRFRKSSAVLASGRRRFLNRMTFLVFRLDLRETAGKVGTRYTDAWNIFAISRSSATHWLIVDHRDRSASQRPRHILGYLCHLAWLAFVAISVRRSGVRALARAGPPLRPPFLAFSERLLSPLCSSVNEFTMRYAFLLMSTWGHSFPERRRMMQAFRYSIPPIYGTDKAEVTHSFYLSILLDSKSIVK